MRLVHLVLACALAHGSIARAAQPAELPTAEELDAAAAEQALQMAMAAAEIGEYQLAHDLAELAMKALVLKVGWGERTTQAAAAITVDTLRKLGREAEADALFTEVRAHLGIADAPASPGTDDLLAAMQAWSDGRLDAAYDRARAGIAALEQARPDDPSLPRYRSMLATLHMQRHEFAEAEALLAGELTRAEATGDALAITRATLGLADLEFVRGAYDRAAQRYQAALDRAADNNEELQRAHAGLGRVAFERGKTDDAIAHMKTRLDLAEHALGGDARLLGALGDLGEVYENVGRFADARPLLEREAAIAEATLGADSALRANSMTRLGRLYRSMGSYDRAIAVWTELLRIQESRLPADAPGIGATLNHFAETLWAADRDPARVIAMATRAAELNERNLIKGVAVGSEAQKRATLEGYVSGTDRVITYNVHFAPRDPAATRLGLVTVLRRKGRVLDAVSGAQQAMRARLDDPTRALFDRLGERRGQIATLLVRGPAEGESAEDHRQRIATAQAEVDGLERELGDRQAVPEDLEPVDLARVQARIPSDAVLVELAIYRRFDPRYRSFARAFGAPHYVAYVLGARGEPTMIPLGPAAPIEAAVTKLRAALADPDRADVGTLAQALERLTMAKIRPHLGKAEHVLLSPDGALNLVPFAALADARGRWLVRDYDFTYLSSGRDLLRLARSHPSSHGAVIVGAPAFSDGAASTGANGRRSMDMSAIAFPPLPGTAAEARAIAEVLPGAELRIGEAASESMVRALQHPAVLHVATHGFFLDDVALGVGERGVTYVKSAARVPSAPENPLVRSGLALRGANLRVDGDDDGILTALEVSSLDLWGTELVVLSACETGVGEVADGDGVYGLRRALVMAGAASQVMSLWKVDDAATADLMVGFYRKLEHGEPRSAALRAAQLHLLRRRATAHPFYWASFIPSGAWTEVELSDAPRRRDRPTASPGRWGGEVREYWRERKLDEANLWIRGAYASSVTDHRFQGADVSVRTGFDLAVDLLLHSRVQGSLGFARDRWVAPHAPGDLDLRINRIQLDLALDLVALPYWWRVRPALLPFVGAGLAFGRQQISDATIDPVTMMATPGSRSNDVLGGIGADFGADAALFIKLGRKLSLQLRGGISRPTYLLRAGGHRLDYDKDFPRSLRWQAGIGLGPARNR